MLVIVRLQKILFWLIRLYQQLYAIAALDISKNYWEAVFDWELDGEVVSSALNGDPLCTYVVILPDDIVDNDIK